MLEISVFEEWRLGLIKTIQFTQAKSHFYEKKKRKLPSPIHNKKWLNS